MLGEKEDALTPTLSQGERVGVRAPLDTGEDVLVGLLGEDA